ncbi:hypothetical protein SODALDRAFT_95330 [Sodiomyces alkalinus F11]|uniref:Uncharacterized protein n=1 Tax=Sodiomyces alkalinus (strain CBS 110278 / VKM F-3762 / F11) TaxID=1314773 RepID=A0A3N2Q0U0_SODAK|nr:hypothetical protein SODALDRAFT_95330 [Sodiomyces alkalinus F11]ROT40383.1 hypothetical protein SODALDRAFT_95330 [Sodiomyces alkalinus F11]
MYGEGSSDKHSDIVVISQDARIAPPGLCSKQVNWGHGSDLGSSAGSSNPSKPLYPALHLLGRTYEAVMVFSPLVSTLLSIFRVSFVRSESMGSEFCQTKKELPDARFKGCLASSNDLIFPGERGGPRKHSWERNQRTYDPLTGQLPNSPSHQEA